VDVKAGTALLAVVRDVDPDLGLPLDDLPRRVLDEGLGKFAGARFLQVVEDPRGPRQAADVGGRDSIGHGRAVGDRA